MSDKKEIDNSSIRTNSINAQKVQNVQNKLFFNTENIKISHDFLFFKNDVLKDVHKLEEKLNLKLTEQNLIKIQCDNSEIKLNELSKYISNVHSLIIDNNDLIQEIKNFMKFKTETENNLNRINSRINTLQKEYRDFSNNIEKLVNENLRYPGIIGKNSKFSNFRFFIDFIMQSIKDVNEFKNEVRHYEINEFKKKMNKDILDFRFAISDNYKNSINLIGINFKEIGLKIADLIKKNNNNMKEKEEKFEELKNKIKDFFSEYKTKFESMEKNINDKFEEQINEIEKFKTMKDEFITDMNNFKLVLDIHKKEINNNENQENNENILKSNSNNNDSIDKVIINNIFDKNINSDITNRNKNSNIINSNINSNIINRNINSNIINRKINSNIINNKYINNNKEFKLHLNSRNINHKAILTKYKRNIPKELLNNINAINEYQHSEEKNNIESLSNKKINSLHLERSKSFEKIPRNLIVENNELKIFQNNKKLNNNNNILNKDISRNNYSISNIPNIKFKKVILPENLDKINLNQTSRNFPLKNKGLKMIQNNNIHSIKLKKNINFNDNISNNEKNINNTKKIKKNKEVINKNIKLSNSNKKDEKRSNFQLNKNMSSFLIIKEKSKNNRLKNLEYMKKNNFSFDGVKYLKDEQVQIEFRKTFNLNYKIRDIILMNSKSFKKSRKIEI